MNEQKSLSSSMVDDASNANSLNEMGIKPDIQALASITGKLEKDRYKKKYMALKRRCQELQKSNERLMHRVYSVQKYIKTLNTHRAILKEKLETYHDDYERMAIEQTLKELEEEQQCSESSDSDEAPATHPPPPSTNRMGGEQASSQPHATGGNVNMGNAFLLYCQKHKSDWMKEGDAKKEMKGEEFTRQMAASWKQLTMDEKQVYYDEFNELKRKYDEQEREESQHRQVVNE